MNRGLIAIALAGVIATPIVLFNSFGAPENTIRIAVTNLAAPVLTMEPGNDTPGYYTNFFGTNCVGNGIALITACIGPTVELSWDAKPGKVYYVQWSTNLVNWQDIRVAHIGVGSRLVWPYGEQRFFRYREE